MACKILSKVLLILAFTTILKAEDELKDFEFSEPGEMMIAQESRQYQTIVKPPVRIVKPHGVTNSHRPQYNLDSYEDELPNEDLEDFFGATTKRTLDYKWGHKKAKEVMIKDAVLRALERKDHVGKFAQILPIIRAMSGQQRVALASLVASQVSTPPGRTPLNLAQVRSMFGNSDNTTSELMLPILLDMANLIRRAVRSGKEPREVKQPHLPQAQLLRRSFTEDTYLDEEPFDIGVETTKAPTRHTTRQPVTTRQPIQRRRIRPQRTSPVNTTDNERTELNQTTNDTIQNTNENITETNENTVYDDKFKQKSSSTTEAMPSTTLKAKPATTPKAPDNATLDLTADATNQTLAQDLPVAEKLRAFNRFIDRKGTHIRRGSYPPKPSPASRRATAEPTLNPVVRRRPPPARKLPTATADQGKCELFTNTLCLHSDDYPTDAIVQSIRRNKAAAGALLADFKDPGEGALDGVTAAQEAKYTAAATADRRGDTANREFATAGEAGFMCPSTVKYARPQRARATSGQWKYIVNTGEHTQTLRLEKCLKPKESCTFLTDNFKSKCVQVYNYHRLLTWDQQNGLHMDIFKVPTCCSCHIEGYSVAFPPLGHRIHETSNENFPGEDLSAEHGNQAFEQVQSTVHRPTKTPPFIHKKPLESFPPFSDNHNLISGIPFHNAKLNDDELGNGNLPPSSPMDSYGNSYFPDSFNQASSVRNVKRPPSRNPPGANSFDSVTLPSYLEPPTPSATSSFFTKETNKIKMSGNQFKRGAVRPNRRPIRKKIGGPEDLTSSGTSAVDNLETMEDFNDDLEEAEGVKTNVNVIPTKRGTISPKLHAVTTERISTTSKPDQKRFNENVTSNGKRVNYNYHPIIDFFEDNGKDDANESIDREDIESSFVPSVSTEWKPINHLPSRNIQTTNLVGRKKHK